MGRDKYLHLYFNAVNDNMHGVFDPIFYLGHAYRALPNNNAVIISIECLDSGNFSFPATKTEFISW